MNIEERISYEKSALNFGLKGQNKQKSDNKIISYFLRKGDWVLVVETKIRVRATNLKLNYGLTNI